MRGDLTVRVNDGHTDRHVTRYTRDLRYRKVANGGHHSASMRLILPRDTFRDLGPADRVFVYDARTGKTMWEGYTENPGITDGPAGQEYDLSAMGGMVLASDQSHKLIYLDTALDQWRRDDTIDQAASATTEVGSFPDTGSPALHCQFNPGQPVATNSQARMIYDAFKGSGMTLGSFYTTARGGANDTAYRMEWIVPGTVFATRDLSTTAATVGLRVTVDFVAGLDKLAVRLRRSGGATNVATDDVWAGFGNMRVLGHRKNRYGLDMGMPEVYNHVLVGDVVEDLLGRVLTMCDAASAVIDLDGLAQIDQLAYHDGATAQQVLEDMIMHQPDWLWEILETLPNGKHRFNYRRWPTTPRYEISVKDGYNAPGGEVDLCNRLAVYWTDEKGNKRTTVVTSTAPELGSRTRDAEPVTLPDGVGSAANAQKIGAQVLAMKANPPKAATATVRRPILDHLTGNTVMPWEIEPGYVARVRETGDDLRMTETEYVDQDGAATLTLGEPQLTIEQRIARLSGRR